MICFPSGPSNSSKAFSFLLCMAATRELPPSSDDGNVFCPGCCAKLLAGKHPTKKKIASAANSRTVVLYHFSMLRFVCCMGASLHIQALPVGVRRNSIIAAHHRRLEVRHHHRHASSRSRERR